MGDAASAGYQSQNDADGYGLWLASIVGGMDAPERIEQEHYRFEASCGATARAGGSRGIPRALMAVRRLSPNPTVNDISRAVNELSLAIDAVTNGRFTIRAPIDMRGHGIKNMAKPVDTGDAQTKIDDLTGTFAPLEAKYVVVGNLDPTLPNERLLSSSTSILITDNGAGSTVTASAIQSFFDALYQPLDPQLTSLAALTYAGNSLKLVRLNVGETGFEFGTPGAGGIGDVVGPASATDHALARFDGITGKLIEDSTATLADDGRMTIAASSVAATADTAGLTINATMAPASVVGSTFGALLNVSNTGAAAGSGALVGAAVYATLAQSTVTNLITLDVLGEVAAGKSTAGAYGLNSQALNAGTVTNLYGGNSFAETEPGGVTTTQWGHRIQSVVDGGGTLGTNYGLQIDAITGGATDNYAIASDGGDSYHVGKFRFGGSTDPVATVDITGSLAATQQITSTLATGTAPFSIASTTLVANLYTARAALADTSTVADAAGDTTTFPLLAGSATGSLPLLTDAGLTYNATTNALTASTFVGTLTGNADTATTASAVAVGGITGLGTGVATALAVNVGSAGAFVTNGGALGTPSSGTLTNATGLPIATGVSGLAAGIAAWLADPTSAKLATAVTNESGSGLLVFNDTPTLIAPLLGTPTSGVLTNCTGLPIGSGVSGLAANVAAFLATPSSANFFAAITDETGGTTVVGSASPTFTGTAHFAALDASTPLAATSGGSGFASYAVGDLLYADTTTTLAKLADVAVGRVLISGGVGTAPSWSVNPLVSTVVFNGATSGTATVTATNVAGSSTQTLPTDSALLVGRIAILSSTGNTAALTAQALTTTTGTAFYRVEVHVICTRAAAGVGASSILGAGVNINYTTGDTSTAVVQNLPMLSQGATTAFTDAGDATNTVGATLYGSFGMQALTGTAITIDVGYTSVGTTTMQYAVRARVERL